MTFWNTSWALRPNLVSLVWSCCLSQRADSVGTRVSDTTAEITMVIARVTANSRNSRPTTSLMNRSGIRTAISETVSDTMVKPICSAPFSAACSGGSPSSM